MGELRGSISVFGNALEGTEPTDRFSSDDQRNACAILTVTPGAEGPTRITPTCTYYQLGCVSYELRRERRIS